MNITVKNLGQVSGDHTSLTKFLLFENGILLCGICQWHKDLAVAANVDEKVKVVGAGVVPVNIREASIEDDVWGGWKSTGYGITTPPELREGIREALIS